VRPQGVLRSGELEGGILVELGGGVELLVAADRRVRAAATDPLGTARRGAARKGRTP
jgi:hypothetical protein